MYTLPLLSSQSTSTQSSHCFCICFCFDCIVSVVFQTGLHLIMIQYNCSDLHQMLWPWHDRKSLLSHMLHPFLVLVLVELMSSQYSLWKYSHQESQGGKIDNTETHCFATKVLRHHLCSPSITHCWSWLSPTENQTCFAWEPEKYVRFSRFLSKLLNIPWLNDHC